jgi:hypothetical protein
MRDRRTTFPVTSCTEYVHRGQPSLWQLGQSAWVLRSNSSGKKVGFVEARRLSEDGRHLLEE